MIPIDATFCPNCGVMQPQQEIVEKTLSKRIVRNSSRVRAILFLISLTMFLLTFFVGSQTKMTIEEARRIVEEFEGMIGQNLTAERIIMNNTFICLQLFIPILGMLYLTQVGFNTGYVLAAYALTNAYIDATEFFLLTLINPVAWVEFTAYSLASSEGVMLILSIIFRFLRKEVKNLFITLIVAVSLLILSGYLEILMIRYV